MKLKICISYESDTTFYNFCCIKKKLMGWAGDLSHEGYV
jgi:hypothetical protein